MKIIQKPIVTAIETKVVKALLGKERLPTCFTASVLRANAQTNLFIDTLG